MSQANEKLHRLVGAFPFGCYVVNTELVNIDDLLNSMPGAIIRAMDVDAVKFIPGDEAPLLGCIAGWVSEDDA